VEYENDGRGAGMREREKNESRAQKRIMIMLHKPYDNKIKKNLIPLDEGGRGGGGGEEEEEAGRVNHVKKGRFV
jgi:hypothetical protein